MFYGFFVSVSVGLVRAVKDLERFDVFSLLCFSNSGLSSLGIGVRGIEIGVVRIISE